MVRAGVQSVKNELNAEDTHKLRSKDTSTGVTYPCPTRVGHK